MLKTSKGFAHIILLLVIVIVAIGGIGYLMYQNEQFNIQKGDDAQSETTSMETENSYPSHTTNTDWPLFINETYKYSFEYPNKWSVHTIDPNDPTIVYILSKDLPVDENSMPKDENSSDYIIIYYHKCEDLGTKTKTPCDTLENLISNIKHDLSTPTIQEKTIKVSGIQATQIIGNIKPGIHHEGKYRIQTVLPVGDYQIAIRGYNENVLQVYNQVLSTFEFID